MQIEDNYLDIQILFFGNQSLGTHQNEFIFFLQYMNLYDEHGVCNAWPTVKTDTHPRTPRIYKVSV